MRDIVEESNGVIQFFMAVKRYWTKHYKVSRRTIFVNWCVLFICMWFEVHLGETNLIWICSFCLVVLNKSWSFFTLHHVMNLHSFLLSSCWMTWTLSHGCDMESHWRCSPLFHNLFFFSCFEGVIQVHSQHITENVRW